MIIYDTLGAIFDRKRVFLCDNMALKNDRHGKKHLKKICCIKSHVVILYAYMSIFALKI